MTRGNTLVAVASGFTVPVVAAWSILQGIAFGKDDTLHWQPQTRGDSARQQAVDIYRSEPGRWDAILFLDGDQTFPRDLIDRLWAHDVDIISGMYFRRTWPPAPIAFKASEGWPLAPLFEYPKDRIFEIGATGWGCLLIKGTVIDYFHDHILRPKEPMVYNGPYPERAGHWRSYGADIRFCDQARQAGFKVWMDPQIQCDHIADIAVNEQMYELAGGWRSWGLTYGDLVKSRIEGGAGMDREVLKARKKQHLIEHDMRKARITKLEAQLEEARQELVGYFMAIKEIDFWLEAEEKARAHMPEYLKNRAGEIKPLPHVPVAIAPLLEGEEPIESTLTKEDE